MTRRACPGQGITTWEIILILSFLVDHSSPSWIFSPFPIRSGQPLQKTRMAQLNHSLDNRFNNLALTIPSAAAHNLSNPHTLILDICPLPMYLASCTSHAMPLSTLSTLLKHPLFPTVSLVEMFPTPFIRHKFSAWRVEDASSFMMLTLSSSLKEIMFFNLHKFHSEAGLSADLQSSGAPSAFVARVAA